MRSFRTLFDALDGVTGTRAKVEALAAHLATTPAADAAWAVALLLGRRRRRLITGRRLREVLRERSGLPAWLIDDCHAHVGDSAETIALLWPQVSVPPGPEPGGRVAALPDWLVSPEPDALARRPLHWWMEVALPQLAALEGEEQADALVALWTALPRGDHFLINKLLSGGFRVGVSSGLVARAIARAFSLEETLVLQRLMGGFDPSAGRFAALVAPAGAGEEATGGRPYPFFLASPLDPAALTDTPPQHWWLEWKWDGIRGQLVRRSGAICLWSRGEELINEAFPELEAMAEALPAGTVLDGEVMVWAAGEERPRGFASLQRRLGRKRVDAALQRELPACFVAYDLLEQGGEDRRQQPLQQRREALNAVVEAISRNERDRCLRRLRLSPGWPLEAWDQLDTLREAARDLGAEGLMLKRIDSPYLAGRRRGHWWKHKLEPMTLDAVLLYAQAGSGRRANLFTDYTFALWDRPGHESGDRRLVTFAKAYSGLDQAEIEQLDRWIRRHTIDRFGPARSVSPELVFELGFEGIHPSSRHKCGLAVRFPRILRWRHEKPAEEADCLQAAQALMGTSHP
ncbi:ATP-dependent DNA ligase [Synechococcus sp. RSCCF101]|uniref:ATP-dependent DNA ligase n=1 Tax=Synechococcus sp. RSCCF101 TaxID=2511069 RepID=UPI00124896F7|nr:ATP-dependent DNA ligase [Synechococcus sp. RSCCF101]QEY31663.1 ATP-dependent DNA ligase [Synechococcus sp. RSCCF101]